MSRDASKTVQSSTHARLSPCRLAWEGLSDGALPKQSQYERPSVRRPQTPQPLEEATKLLQPLLQLAENNIETHLMAFEIYYRKGEATAASNRHGGGDRRVAGEYESVGHVGKLTRCSAIRGWRPWPGSFVSPSY